jgi:hypothetical protein
MKSWMSRSARLGFAAFLAALVAACMPMAGADPAMTVSALSIDVSPLRDKGLGPYADRVGTLVLRAASGQFAVQPGSNAPRVVLSITQVQLAAAPAGTTSDSLYGGGSGVDARDYIEGNVMLVSGRDIVTQSRIVTGLAVDNVGWMQPGYDDRRLANLADVFAQWARVRLAQH